MGSGRGFLVGGRMRGALVTWSVESRDAMRTGKATLCLVDNLRERSPVDMNTGGSGRRISVGFYVLSSPIRGWQRKTAIVGRADLLVSDMASRAAVEFSTWSEICELWSGLKVAVNEASSNSYTSWRSTRIESYPNGKS